MSQGELARLSDAGQRDISHYERGRSFPKLDRLDALAIALGVPLFELFRIGEAAPSLRVGPDALKIALLVEREAATDPSFPRRALRILRETLGR